MTWFNQCPLMVPPFSFDALWTGEVCRPRNLLGYAGLGLSCGVRRGCGVA